MTDFAEMGNEELLYAFQDKYGQYRKDAAIVDEEVYMPLKRELLRRLTRLRKIERLAAQMIKEPDSLCYPERDVYNEHNVEDVNAPLWTECGLYGRVGKEAARTLLSRYKQLHTFLDAMGPP